MKQFILIILLLIGQFTFGQSSDAGLEISMLNGMKIPMDKALKQAPNKPLVLFLWCSHSHGEYKVDVLDMINDEYYDEWREELGLKFVAINTESSLASERLKEIVMENGWYFDNYQDTEGIFQSSLSGYPMFSLFVNDTYIGPLTLPDLKKASAEKITSYMDQFIRSPWKSRTCWDQEGWITDWENANLIRYVDSIDGVFEVQYRTKSGMLKSQSYFSDRYLKTREGIYEGYYPDGSIFSIEKWSAGVRNGRQSYWYENGRLSALENYVLGEKSGIQISYNENGTIESEKQYEKGRLLEILTLNDEHGNALEIGEFKNGNGYYYDYKNGKMTLKISMVDGFIKGEVIHYDEEGKESYRENIE